MNKISKVFAVLFAALFILSGSLAMAAPPYNPGPGYYEFQNPGNPNDGRIQYFANGQPENNSQWHFIGTTPPPPPVDPPPPPNLNLCKVTVNGNYQIYGQSIGGTFAISNHGLGNDFAQAWGVGDTYAGSTLFGNGTFFAFQTGFAIGNSKTEAYAFAKDFGLTSIAGAGVEVTGSALTGGIVIAPSCRGSECPQDFSTSMVTIGGTVYQSNVAQEIGYFSGTGAVAMNESGGYFIAGNSDSSFGTNGAASLTGIAGSIKTDGFSMVTVDPIGHSQSAFGITTNSVEVNIVGRPDSYEGKISGIGSVQTVANAQNIGSAGSAGATGSFSYVGAVQGFGVASNFSAVQAAPHSFSAQAGGFSFATAK